MPPLTGGASSLAARGGRALRLFVFYLLVPTSAGVATIESRGTFLVRESASLLRREGRGSRVKLDIYYESMCPQSLRTLNSTFREAWSHPDLRKRIELNLIAFGNAQVLNSGSISQGYKFWHPKAKFPLVVCQHGETECLGNKIHSCAVDLMKDPEQFVPFVTCMASYGPAVGVEKTSFECSQKLGGKPSIDSIRTCAYSERGHTLHVANGKSTMDPKIGKAYVPWVMINGVHDKEAEGDNLIKQLCGAMDDPKPGVCAGKANSFTEDQDGENIDAGADGVADGSAATAAKTPAEKKPCGTGKGGSGGDFL